jgi:citrate lyase subunit beta / citryl-CoA lyase
VVNDVFTPARDEWERAEAILAAYERAGTEGRGTAMFEGEMIDEANRKMAARLAQQGRAAGYAA